jgi:hypothetical protein
MKLKNKKKAADKLKILKLENKIRLIMLKQDAIDELLNCAVKSWLIRLKFWGIFIFDLWDW